MNEKFYCLVICDWYTGEIVSILNFHSLDNAVKEGKKIIKDYCDRGLIGDEYDDYSLEEYYKIWEEDHIIRGLFEIAESKFED